jgi:hypothetical protein
MMTYPILPLPLEDPLNVGERPQQAIEA